MSSVIAAAVAAVVIIPGSLSPGDWAWPLDDPAPRVVREFDPPDKPWSAGHRGVDLAGEPGDIVRAAGAGTVSYARLIAGVGVVTVSHGAVRTTYQPVAPSVSVGQRVEISEPIGVLTVAGSHCPPEACLHWGLIQGASYLDPLRLVTTAGPPRLLPLGTDALTRADGQPPPSEPGVRITARAAAGALAGLVP